MLLCHRFFFAGDTYLRTMFIQVNEKQSISSLSDKFMDYVLCCNFNTMIAAITTRNGVTDRQDLVHDEIMTHFIIYNDICVHYYIIKKSIIIQTSHPMVCLGSMLCCLLYVAVIIATIHQGTFLLQ